MNTQDTPVKYIDFTESYNPGMKYWGGAFVLLIVVATFVSPRIDPGIGARSVFVACALFVFLGYAIASIIDIVVSFRSAREQSHYRAGYLHISDRYAMYGILWFFVGGFYCILGFISTMKQYRLDMDRLHLLWVGLGVCFGVAVIWGLVAQAARDRFEISRERR